ncbi:MFS transporter [Amycolatopsis azurea]|uniref:MFS transporter n=1 Tax=Amycolatopsis azurea TaxID=36819 RepID=UPI00381B33FD
MQMTSGGTRTGYRTIMRVPGMPSVYLAHAVSMAGTLAAEVALSILVYQRTGSALLSAMVLTCSFLPYLLGGTVLSSIADRFPARRVLVCCDLISGACVAAMLIPGMPVPGLLGLVLVTGIVSPIFQGTRAASLARLLPPEVFPLGRSLLRTVSQVTVVTGFGLGSVLVAAVGPHWLLAADAVSFGLSAALIGLATPATSASGTSGSVVRASTEGLRLAFANRPLRRLLLLSWAVPLFSSVHDGLAIAYTVQTGVGAQLAGAIFTGYAVGTVAGELVVSHLSPVIRRRLVVPLVLISQLPAVLFFLVPPLPVAVVLVAVSGAGFAFNQGIDPLILRTTTAEHRGRLFTIQVSGLMVVQGAGIALAGLAGTYFRPSLVLCAVGLLGTVTVLLLARRALLDFR